MKYSKWALWLNLSIISLIIIAFIGDFPGSKENVPYWPIMAALAVINLALCIIIGKLIKEDYKK